ncbi:MAG: MMPL family transporter [Chloroflexi bacterium]|nr:MMPL family transporter [Chloroflexota bacterium]
MSTSTTRSGKRESGMRRLAAFCYRRRGTVTLAWVAALIALGALGGIFGGATKTNFAIPGAESQDAIDFLREHGFSERSGDQGMVVVEAQQGVDDPAVRTAVEGLLGAIQSTVAGTTVTSFYEPGAERQIAPGRKIAFAELNFSDRTGEQYLEAARQVTKLRDQVHVEGLRVELGGGTGMFADQSQPPSELIGVAGAILILVLAFGSLLAMGLPIMTALFGIGIGLSLLALAANLVDMPTWTSQVAMMIGIGVGIDYALFIVTRYRDALREGREPAAAVALAIDTAGRAVLFAGLTVVLAVLGLIAMGRNLNLGLAVGTSLTVLLTMAAAVTLLPAVLGFVGRKIDWLALPFARPKPESSTRHSIWWRWSRVVQRRPWPAAVGALALLLVLALPVLSLRLGFGDAGNDPRGDTTREAYDLLSTGFGPGFNGPLLIAASTPGGDADVALLRQVAEQLRKTPGIAAVTDPILNQAGDAAILQVYPATSPQDEATTTLVKTIRRSVLPSIPGTGKLELKVGGATAGVVDFSSYTAERMPLFLGAVLALSFLLLMAVFRSLLVPLKAVIMNLLSVGAAYGVVVAVFQWGWGASLIGLGKDGPIEAWVPMMLFAVVFGLSMDYEVFLLSRIREEFDRTGDNGLAVADGLAATGRVITAAALIMVLVFSSFILSDNRALKLMGLGLSVAVFVDATLVRMVLVPATMELLGKRNWWLPAWLGRVLPVIHVEAAPETGYPAAGGD